MQLISTHIAADFDATASVIAAQKLHPEAKIFFPGSREESVRKMLDAEVIAFDELRQKQIDPKTLERVILVDVRQKDRIGVLAEWLEEHPQVEVLAYDHHGDTPSDVAVAGGIVDPEAGSTSTILVEELDRRGLELTDAEATVLLLGIHEDTGSLTYANSHPRDYRAAARLLEAGADLEAVRRFAGASLDPRRLDILHRMTEELTVFRIRDHRVGVVALELGEYVEELAPLVSRLIKTFELPLLFALLGEGDRVSIIARGDVDGVHLGRILEDFAGGGGHATAASARVKGRTPLEVRESLLAYLEAHLSPARRVGDLMIDAFFHVTPETPVEEAKTRLIEYRVNAAPVLDEDGRVVGAISRQTLDVALQHGFEDRPVERVMSRDVEWVSPEAPVSEVAGRILDRSARIVLVGSPNDGRPLGLVTRMDVMRHLYGQLTELEGEVGKAPHRQGAHRREVKKLLRERLTPEVASRVEAAARVSRRMGLPVYLVGGLVRDLLLERPNRDLDLVVRGDGIAFARQLAAELDGRCSPHEPFLTAVVVDPEDFHIDVATARSEFYREPAALPQVRSSTLRQDLYRRDFTINTLAIRIGPEGPPVLIDHFGGGQDLEHRTLRVLHSLSFVDDPTRVLRAVRLELRLGFEMSPETLHLVQVALTEGVFDRLSGARLREELAQLLEQPDQAVAGLERLAELGLLPVLHEDLEWGPRVRERLVHVRAAWDWYELEGVETPEVRPARLFLYALACDLSDDARGELGERLQLAQHLRDRLEHLGSNLQVGHGAVSDPDKPPHRVSDELAHLDGEELLLVLATENETGRAWIRRELTEMRSFGLTIGGQDLIDRGFEPGPQIGEALRAARAARLDGEIGPDEELEVAVEYLEEER